MNFNTKVIHGGQHHESATGSVNVPAAICFTTSAGTCNVCFVPFGDAMGDMVSELSVLAAVAMASAGAGTSSSGASDALATLPGV